MTDLADRTTTIAPPPLTPRVFRTMAPENDQAVVPVIGETTATPGIVVVPAMAHTGKRWSFTGEWDAVHELSGRRILPATTGSNLGHAHDTASLLGDSAIDWTAPHEQLAGTVADVVWTVREQIATAIERHQPARMTATSWSCHPPMWWIDTAAGPELAYETETDAVTTLDTIELDGWIRRDEDPSWQMRCAATECRELLEEPQDCYTLREQTRDLLIEQAGYQDWRQLDDRRWLCGQCSAAYRAVGPTP